MKKKIALIAVGAGLSISFLGLLNMPVTTRQGVNYVVRKIKIPLYLKLLDFWDRHYNYKNLVDNITKGAGNEKEKISRIFVWTNKNLRKNPKELPVIDDHVWNIIVRGYGVDDQFQDVFSTLCNYTGARACYNVLLHRDGKSRMALSFVKMKRGWSVFDAYSGVYFENSQGEFAVIDELMTGKWIQKTISPQGETRDYGAYFPSLSDFDERNSVYSRSAVQSPLRRLILWLKKN